MIFLVGNQACSRGGNLKTTPPCVSELWVNDHRGMHPAADSQDIEHQQAWPRGRTNHYGFDLNRVPDPTQGDNLLRGGGRGLLLIQTFVDEFTVKKATAGGAEVILVKYANSD